MDEGNIHEGQPLYQPDIAHGNRLYTYQDYVTWSDDERCEILDGERIVMDSPSRRHQMISVNLTAQIQSQLSATGLPCILYHAPMDLLPFLSYAQPPDDQTVVVQPDLFVSCTPQASENYVSGAPDLVIEILSLSTGKLDKVRKRAIYERARVPEYWIVDPEHRMVDVYRLRETSYGPPDTYGADDEIVWAVTSADRSIVIHLTNVFT